MQEQKLETSDETMPTWKVEKHNSTQNRIRFKNSIASIGDTVTILKSEQHQHLVDEVAKMDSYIAKINQLEFEINNADIRTLTKTNEDLQKQIKNKDKSIATFKTNSIKNKTTIDELHKKIDKYKQTIADKDATILGLQKENETTPAIEDLQETIQQQKETIAELKQMNDKLGLDKDKLEKQLEDSVDASEHQELLGEVAGLKEQLATSENQHQYFKDAYTNLIDSSDALASENENYKHQNEKLRNDNNAINETNKLLNENIIGLKTTFDETKQELTTNAENTEKELKETIKNMQLHIDETTNKYQSLLPLKDYIPTKQHYDEIQTITDELNQLKLELQQKDSEIETKLAIQKSELDSEYNQEKAQMLVIYNKELDNLKLGYNNLANQYNNLINDLFTITKWNALIDSRHEKIRKDKENVELLEITSEQLPPADENVLEYVPKN